MFANFNNYTICNTTDPEKPITVFMDDSFLEDIENDDSREYIALFFKTQTFANYRDKCLRKKDKIKATITF